MLAVMSLIRTPEQTRLAELQAIGSGMLTRYEALQAQDAQPLVDFLRQLLARRRELLEAVASAAEARGDLPSAGDQAVNEIHALADRFLSGLFGEQTLYERVANAESSWSDALEKARHLDWHGTERKLLQALLDESHDARQRLDAMTPEQPG
jgi:hypothetical protein